MVRTLHSENAISFLGRVDREEVLQKMREANIFTLISDDEVYGMVYIEAMLQGCLVIASKGGGFDGIIVDGENGFLCNPGDSEIRHGEKMYETLLTNEECAKAIDLGGFYCVPADNRGLNYDKYFKDGDETRNVLTEFNSSNTDLLDKEQVKGKLLQLDYIRNQLM